MFEMIAYVCVPYTTLSRESMNQAVDRANRHIATLYKTSGDKWCFVSSIYSVYDHVEIGKPVDQVYPVSRSLIEAADIVILLRMPGYEHCELAMNEMYYAAHKNKTIVEHDPYWL